MSAFIIYAIILTLAYIIYYCAMITKECYAKQGQKIDNKETFDFSGMNDQIPSVTVTESKEGFFIGEETPDMAASENNEDFQSTSDDEGVAEEGTEQEESQEQPSEAELHAEKAEALMEDSDIEFSDSVDAYEYEAILLNPSNSVPVIIVTDERDEL